MFRENALRVVQALDAYGRRAHARSGRTIAQAPIAQLTEALELEHWMAEGGLEGEAFSRFLDGYLAASTKLHDPRYMAHQVAVPHPMGSLGALVDAFTNNAPTLYEMGPPGAAVEYAFLNWMLRKVGWTPAPFPGTAGSGSHGGGVLVHGGSLANLTALMAAKARVAPDAWREGLPRDLVLVAPEACHYSIGRTAEILGLGRNALLSPPVDVNGRIQPDRLMGFVRSLQARGARLLAVVANACSTSAGLFDPIRETAKVCRELGLWLHVDAAHGASALVSERYRGLLDGVELADSIVWDAHKMLRAPIVCAAVLVRDHRHLDEAFHQEASYLFHDKEQPGIDLLHRTVECTKGALGLKAFLALAGEGEKGIARYVERQADLAREAATYLAARAGFELAVEPPFNIICFRVEGSDERQLEIRRRVLEHGTHYLTTTNFRGRRWLRVTLMNPETEMADVLSLVEEVKRHMHC